jgi:arginyl-tRNA synthetase
MVLEIHARIREALRSAIEKQWGIEPPEIALNLTPKVEMGELATPVSFELAKRLKKAPRAVATDLIAAIGAVPGVAKAAIAGAGFINFFFDRGALVRAALRAASEPAATPEGKIIVEHTNINPNKAAHIGHLRNAALGDTFVRVLKARGHSVETQNYIDNTGVQVADVIVGFKYLEKKSVAEVRAIASDPNVKFDYYCWDLYARVGGYYETGEAAQALRAQTLKEIEEGDNDTAEMAEAVAMTIVRCHLATMARINVHYDLLPRESDILHLKFWDRAFQRLRDSGAIFFENEGKNRGCWVMRIDTEGYDDDKIIVRSNGTVTYTGKDIAYQLWKLGLLEKDFLYRRMEGTDNVWVTTSENGESNHPSFGRGHAVYNVIDVRQSYPQNVVRQGVRALGYEREVENSIHFHYERVALTPACAAELGITIPPEDQGKAHVEVSGRKGQGVKADDLVDRLETLARKEVSERNPELDASQVGEIARQIAVGALRYFLLKYTRTAIIAFDFREALSFEGETGPYLQYAAVRANNIFRKAEKAGLGKDLERVEAFIATPEFDALAGANNDIWELVYMAARLDEISNQVIVTLETASLAKYAFTLAQRLNRFYHDYRIIDEEDANRRMYYLAVVDIARRSLTRALDAMGIAAPPLM